MPDNDDTMARMPRTRRAPVTEARIEQRLKRILSRDLERKFTRLIAREEKRMVRKLETNLRRNLARVAEVGADVDPETIERVFQKWYKERSSDQEGLDGELLAVAPQEPRVHAKLRSQRLPTRGGDGPSRKESSMPEWKAHLDSYGRIVALRFPSRKEFARGLDRAFSRDLRAMPFDLLGAHTIAVPDEAVPFFSGLSFEQQEIVDGADLPTAELIALRRERDAL